MGAGKDSVGGPPIDDSSLAAGLPAVTSQVEPPGNRDQDPSAREAQLSAALDARVLAMVRPILLALLPLYALYTLLHLYQMSGGAMLAMATCSSVTMILLAVLFLRLPRVPVTLGHPLAWGIGMLLLINSELQIYLTGDIRQSTNVALLIIGSSCVLLSAFWHTSLVVVALAAWGAILTTLQTTEGLVHFAVMMITTTVFSAVVLRARVRAETRLIRYGSELEDRVRERTAELRREIAERERTAAVLRESEARFRLLAEHADDIVFRYRVRPNAGWEYVGPSSRAILGHAPEDFYAHPRLPLRMVVAEDRPALMAVLRAKSEPETPLTLRWRHKDGTSVWLEQRHKRLHDEQGRVVAIEGIARDVSERKRQEEERAHLGEKLQRSQKLEAIGQLTAGIAHNFNNLLAVVMGHIEVVRLGIAEDAQQALEVAYDAAERAAKLVGQLMLFGRRVEAAHAPVDVSRVVDEVVRMCRETFDRRLTLRVEDAGPVPQVLGDAGQLNVVLLNLCINARDALESVHDREPRLVIRTSVVRSEARAYVVLTVEDNGPGIPAHRLDRIFEPFFTTKEVGKGTGLGLATAYGIISQHNGRIEVESEPDVGTRFRIYLPTAEAREKGDEGECLEGLPAGQTGSRTTVLVVDDEVSVRTYVRAVLQSAGHSVVLAANGREALSLFEAQPDAFGVVILDVSMPGMSGQEVLAAMRRVRPAAKVIICSGYALDLAALEGASAILPKPHRVQQILQTVREVLDSDR